MLLTVGFPTATVVFCVFCFSVGRGRSITGLALRKLAS